MGSKSMRKLIPLLLILPLLISCTQLQVGNTFYATAIGATTVDWLQTRDIVRKPYQYSEVNPILGRNPSYAQVDRYFPVALGLIAFSYPMVKPEWRPYLYGTITLLESVVVVNNM